MMRSFREYQPNERRNYITLSTGEYYPDILVDACKLYSPVLTIFSDILHHSGSSVSLFLSISEVSNQWMRTQLCRVFRKYVSPETPVEMLKKNTKARQICDEFGEGFRAIHTVQEMFDSRPFPDEALCAILWEYKDRGKKGYDLTEKFFDLMQTKFPDMCIWGPKRSGADVQAIEVWALNPGNEESTIMCQIFSNPKFRESIHTKNILENRPSADAYIVAKGKFLGATVVTAEEYKPNSAQLPNLCQAMGVHYIGYDDFMEAVSNTIDQE